MSTPVWCEIVCGECANTTAGQFTYRGVPRRTMTKKAKARGWECVGNEWYCSKLCQRRAEKSLASNGAGSL